MLRSRIQYHQDATCYVFAGSEPSMMRELFENRERPLFGQALALALGPLPGDDTVPVLADRFVQEGLDPGASLGDLVVFAEGHPQRTMLLAYLLASALSPGTARPGRAPVPSAALTDQIIDEAIEVTASIHQATWAGSDASERAVLAAVADGNPPSSAAVAADHNVAKTTLAAAATRLADRGHLHREARASRLVDPLLAEWVRRR